MSDFTRATIIRAVRTFAQTAVALIGTNAAGITDVDWVGVASGAALAGIVSVLTSIATDLPEAPKQLPPVQPRHTPTKRGRDE